MIRLADVEQFFETWAPRWTAWERDNVGIQVGRRNHMVQRALVALEVTEDVVTEAVKRKVDTIISHHPLLFRPLKSLSDDDGAGQLALELAERKIALYSAHTNLDAAPEGVSITLARSLGVAAPRFLTQLTDTLVKIAVFVPESHVDRVSAAMADAGAGVIGEYVSCSFQLRGKGTFRGSEATRPFAGTAGKLEHVEEIRLEMLAPKAQTNAILRAMKSVHPYEEVAYDIYTLKNGNPNFGMGAIGELPRSIRLSAFLKRAKTVLRAESIRYAGSLRQNVRTVAVCGGSGSELLGDAQRAGADVFVTADVRYHTFHDAGKRMALVDAGHWETEQVILPVIVERLHRWVRARGKTCDVMMTTKKTNPIHVL